jgi:hypothetical protein
MRAGTGETGLAPLWRTTGKPSRFSSEIGNEDRREAATTGFLRACAMEFAPSAELPAQSRVRLVSGWLWFLKRFSCGFEG